MHSHPPLRSFSHYIIFPALRGLCQQPQNWTNNANTAKHSYRNIEDASDWEETIGSGTNCQAGFYAADKMLDSARDEALTYVVYMSDGEANSYYADLVCDNDGRHHDHNRLDCYEITTDVEHADEVFANNRYTEEGAEAAKLQASVLKDNHPETKIITVGLGTGSNSVLDPEHVTEVWHYGYWDCAVNFWHKNHDFWGCTWVEGYTEEIPDGNTAVDEFHSGGTDTINSIYDSIATQITLESDPWMVTDYMSDYVEFVPNSVQGSSNVTWDSGSNMLKWDLEKDAAGSNQKSFTMSYLVRLKDTDNTASSIWGYNEDGSPIWHPEPFPKK